MEPASRPPGGTRGAPRTAAGIAWEAAEAAAGGDAEGQDRQPGAAILAAEIEVIVADPAWRRLVPRAETLARRAAVAALAEAPPAEAAGTVSVLLTGDREMRRLNGAHRGLDKPTNVLSFPGEVPGHLGDIALALGVVRREASAAGRRPAAHLAHLVAHGTLHLIGHDHLAAGEARRMERAEARAMARLRLPNPWKGGGRRMSATNGNGAQHGAEPTAAQRRDGLLWRLQGLLRRREAESVRDRMEELIEEGRDALHPAGPAGPRPGGPAGNGGGLDAQERALLGNVLKLRDKTAYDVMVPRADIMAMPEEFTLEQAIGLIQRDGHSRYPVYRGQLDDIVGMVHIKDVFASVGREGPFDMKAILRRPLFVVPSVPVLDLLLQMRQSRIHMALVVDEYGGIDGLITIEDLVETIVGDISDEHDEPGPPQMVERPDGTIELDGRTPVEAFEAKLGPVLTGEERGADIDTVGGLVFTLAGRVPARGELVSHSSGLEFRVLEADPRRIRRLRVRRPGVGTQKQAAE